MPVCLCVFAALLTQVAQLLEEPFEHQMTQNEVPQ